MVICGVMVMSTQPVVSIAGEASGGSVELQSALGLDSTDSVLCSSVQLSRWAALLLVITWQTILVWLQLVAAEAGKA